MQVVLWAMLTGGVTGAVWIAIVLLKRQQRLSAHYRALLDRTEDRVVEMERVHQRLMELEERVDSTQQQVVRTEHQRQLPPQ